MVTLKPLYMAGESVLVTQSGPILCNPMDCAHQAPLSMGFSRQEYWSGWPYPSPGIFQTQGSNPGLPHCRQILYHLSYLRSPSVGGWFKTKILFSFGENMLADPTAL